MTFCPDNPLPRNKILPVNTMRFHAIVAFAALAFATEDLSSPNTSPELHARKIGGKCKHGVRQTRAHDHTENVLTAPQGIPGTCQKTSKCANDLGWYSNNDCPDGEWNVAFGLPWLSLMTG
jgi:hypothetical protein